MKSFVSRSLTLLLVPFLLWGCATQTPQAPQPFQFVYTSDSHYGITREAFRGKKNVNAREVNAALVAQINSLPKLKTPCDEGVKACTEIGGIDFLINSGDMANRMTKDAKGPGGVQSAAASWKDFASDYLQKLTITDAEGKPSRVYLLPGNHDVSNAIGHVKPMVLARDATSMAEIYNRMLQPATPRTAETYNYATDKVNYSKDINGVHFAFINMWPDSQMRAWLEDDLKNVPETTPVIIVTHDQPDIVAKHLTNPNGKHDLNAKDKFQNLLNDQLTTPDAQGKLTTKAIPTNEHRAFARFLKAHRNIVAYFHGDENFNEYYVWKGPDNDIRLNIFRVDSPMKGNISEKDESKLSFQFVAVDPAARKMTVREYLWNAVDKARAWGEAITVSLEPRPAH